MVLLIHVLYVGAVFILNPTSTGESNGEPWYDSLSCFFSSKFGCVLLLDVAKRSADVDEETIASSPKALPQTNQANG
jgi:hypothetical protein